MAGHADAIVIGSGPNGLVAANLLADAGWEVVVLEAQAEPGGAVRSGEIVEPGFVHDRFSAFYPLGAASPVLRDLELEEHGLRWARAPVVVAHPSLSDPPALLFGGEEETAANLEGFAAGDGAAWRELIAQWREVGDPLLHALMEPFPPVRAGARLARRLGPSGLARFARFGLLPVRRMGEERFRGPGGPRLLAGNALHSDLGPEMPGSGMFGWVLCGLAQTVGFPVPVGGSGELTQALVRRLRARGGEVRCGAPVTRVLLDGRRARGVRCADGEEWGARRAVLADTSAPALWGDLVGPERLSPRRRRDLERFQYDAATFKVNWSLDSSIPWSSPEVGRAGTVHLAEGIDALTRHAAELACGQVPSTPYLVLGQYGAWEGSRQPPGKDTVWAYTHLPQRIRGDAGGEGIAGDWGGEDTERFARRIEDVIEAYAPGFRGLVRARDVQTPADLQAADANLVRGALNGGTAQLHQQLVLRPFPGLGRPETEFERLFLASASAHPGGGVHGACGANAARAALGQLTPRAARIVLRAIR